MAADKHSNTAAPNALFNEDNTMNATTVLYDERVASHTDTEQRGDQLWLTPTGLQAATGWKLETEGLCRGDTCARVDPIRPGSTAADELI